MTRARRLQNGGALLITIGILATLVAILSATAATQHVTLRGIGNRMALRRARIMAESGIQQALATLAAQNTNQTTQNDDWYTQIGQTGATRYLVGSDSFRFEIVDAAGMINLNTAPQEQLLRLPLTTDQVDSLLDWREGGITPRADGAKDEYYNGLATPYNAKLQGLSTLDELLLVKGFTPKTIYEPQTDVSSTQPLAAREDGQPYTLYQLCTVDSTSSASGANGTQLPNINTVNNAGVLTRLGIPNNVATAIVNGRGSWTSYRALLQLPGITNQIARQLVDNYGVSNAATSTGKINVNTASEAVLDSIPNMPPDIATSIVQQQSTGFTQLGDLFNVSGLSTAVAAGTFDLLSTNSQTFVVRVIGTAGESKVSLEALVSLTANGPRVLKITRPPHADMSADWAWDDQPSNDTTIMEAPQQ
jgi:DNA uptake protein ComE-like DNA-binding protein